MANPPTAQLHKLLSHFHDNDVIMVAIASQITSLTIVYSVVYSNADHRKHQSSSSLAFVRGIHREPVNSPHKWLVSRKMFPFVDVIMRTQVISNGLKSSWNSVGRRPLAYTRTFSTWPTLYHNTPSCIAMTHTGMLGTLNSKVNWHAFR